MGKAVLHYTEKEIGRMTLRKFMKLYEQYKKHFDLEMQLRAKGVTYAKLAELQMQEEEWL